MHVVSLEKAAIEDLVYTKLNENEMDLMRKLLYGVILDDKTTKKLKVYLEGRLSKYKVLSLPKFLSL